MPTRLAGFVYALATGLPVNGATVTPRASDGSIGTTGVTNSAGFVAVSGLADKTWFGTVASSSQVFIPALETFVTDDIHNQANVLSAHDASQIRGLAAVIAAGAAEGDAVHVGDLNPHTGYVLKSLLLNKGAIYVASSPGAPAGLAVGTDGYKIEARASEATGLKWGKDYVPILFVIDGGGATITTGIKGDIYLLENLTVEGWTLLADQSGSIVLDVWQDTYANYPPTVADTITASDKPTISAATKGQDLAPTGWTTSLNAGSSLRINVDSITTCQRVSLMLHCYRR